MAWSLLALMMVNLALVDVEAGGSDAAGWSLGRHGDPPVIDAWRPVLMLDDGLQADAQVTKTPNGLDIAWTVSNPTATDAAVPELRLPLMDLGDEIVAMDFYRSGWPQRLMQRGPHTSMMGVYPGTLYAPVAVLMTTRLAIGVTVQYPVLEYRHECALGIEAAGDGHWQLRLVLGGDLEEGMGSIRRPAIVPAGQTRTWTITVRASADPLHWLDTLEPYRHFFQSRYGGVQYTRDPRAIRGVIPAFGHLQSEKNPSGWVPEANRPDQHGYAGVVALMQQALGQADRVILWAPSGRALDHRALNLPFRFTSHWLDGGPQSPFADAPRLLRLMPLAPTQQWGLWWGHSMESTPAWDTPPQTPLNLSDQQQRSLFLSELQGAIDAGAVLVGLDEFTTGHVGAWDRVAWLTQLQAAAPGITFCSEGMSSDILHRLAPTWLDLYRAKPDRFGGTLMIRGPFLLADWLLPGHETWAGMLFDRSSDPALHADAIRAAESRMAVIRGVARDGYIPVVFADLPVRHVIIGDPEVTSAHE